jgi:proto-oncogene tyrosine-protein kinase ROS
LSEEYHKLYHSYFHNTYDGVGNSSIIVVCANNSNSQPIPIPVNPPTNVQALLSSDRAKISWRIPHLLGNQGKGAWQNWNYELEIVDSEIKSRIFPENGGSSYTVKNLTSNTTYKFRVAAYSKVGIGPWSQQFIGRTLKSAEERYLIWSANDGLMQSDVIGERVTTLIPKASLSEESITDITWYENILYFVSGSKLKLFNRTNGRTIILGDFDSLEAIGIDWLGKKLYWSNPSAQLITRGNLEGEQPEILPIIAAATQIRIDSLRGNLYYSTSLTVDTCRLNGKNRRNYYSERAYSGKKVMGLTLDLENEKIYWMVRSFSESSLFSAPLVDQWTEKTPLVSEIILEEPNLIGGLNHFSDRLMWLQDEKTVVVADIAGKNLAYLKNEKLAGLRAVSVIDVTYHIFPDSNFPTNVIPEPVKNYSIETVGSWKIFNISWDPVENVNYGKVSTK